MTQGWKKQSLREPSTVYQLSLRLGISYEAACWALVGQKVVTAVEGAALREVAPKQIKTALSAVQRENPWSDVWHLSARDSGALIEASTDDVFVVTLEEDPSTGYLWSLVDAGPGIEIVDDRSVDPDTYGGHGTRLLSLRFGGSGRQRLVFKHARPWSKETTQSIDFLLDTSGKEQPGLARVARESLVGSAG